MGKIWKLYDDKANMFYDRDFDGNESLAEYWGFDFFYREIWNWEHSERGCVYEMWDCVLNPGDVVVDLGANCGFFTERAAAVASRVLAVEGSPEHYSCLVQNMKDRSNVSTLNSIVADRGDSFSDIWSVKGNPLRMGLVEAMDLFGLDRIDFLKCDIEGSEYSLFGNLGEDVLSRIDRIAVETHDDVKNENFYLPGKIRHSFYWNYGGSTQTMFYFVTPK